MTKLPTILVIFLAIAEAEMMIGGGVIGYNEKSTALTKCNEDVFKFRAENKDNFNCTVAFGQTGGDLYCISEPCKIGSNCNWQVYPGTEVKPGIFYYLYQCHLCPTIDCNKKYAYASTKECGFEGVFKTYSYGRFWYCENKNCKGEMKERTDKKGHYYCQDDKCWGTGKLDEFYQCKDPTCVGYMQWDQDAYKWACQATGCEKVDGRMIQKSTGWECESPSCPGKMLFTGYIYQCVDPNCKGDIEETFEGAKLRYICREFVGNQFSYFVIGLAVILIIGIITCIMNKKNEKNLKTALKNPHGFDSFSGVYQAPQNYYYPQNYQSS